MCSYQVLAEPNSVAPRDIWKPYFPFRTAERRSTLFIRSTYQGVVGTWGCRVLMPRDVQIGFRWEEAIMNTSTRREYSWANGELEAGALGRMGSMTGMLQQVKSH
ncbi:hypothetical protein N7468_001480 [Penicillium chermesinum]|uniref:Uncharacterized protein n=1 Tax=Penicillium chermesinum TaxID=63820 RepID=A0A9W9PHZ8_9EURO|nr:uncharacterized protein N7468_001480 [Penicillium chermesinum]KAJ5246497.1 hypothetical protein N7468_001480 [Penicillium chermesinum]